MCCEMKQEHYDHESDEHRSTKAGPIILAGRAQEPLSQGGWWSRWWEERNGVVMRVGGSARGDNEEALQEHEQ